MKDIKKLVWLYLSPAILFLVIFVGGPIVQFIYNSFFEISPIKGGPREFIGLENYLNLFSDDKFWLATAHTLQYGALVVIAEITIGFAIAIVFSALGKKSRVLRVVFTYPLMIAPIVAGILWKFLLIENFGILNEVLLTLGIVSDRNAIGWLSDPSIALFSVAIPDVWLTTSFVALVTYAGLQNLPGELIEAARLDGANTLQVIFRIIVPLMRPVLGVVLIIRGIDALRAFDVILVQTEGGPQFSTTTLSLLTYRTITRFGDPGLGSAMGVVFLLGCMVLAALALKFVWSPGEKNNGTSIRQI